MSKYGMIPTKISQIFSFWRHPAPSINPVLPPEGLLALPVEILLLISDFLPIHATACLAISSRVFHHLLACKAREALQLQDTATRLEFLNLLSKDRTLHYTCYDCVRLHSIGNVYRPHYPAPERLYYAYIACHVRNPGVLPKYSRTYNPMWTSHIGIGFPHIQSAMKRHNSGSLEGVPLSAFSFAGLEDTDRGYKIIISVEARIVEGNFLYRANQTFLLPRDCCHDFFKNEGLYTYSACQHKRKPVIIMLKEILDGWRPLPRHEHCPDCCMDYELIGLDCGETGIALSFIRWLDFGAGLYPGDRKWKNHFDWFRGFQPYIRGHAWGSIRESFEGARGESLASLRSANVRRWASWLRREQDSSANQVFWLQRGRKEYSMWWTLEKYMSGMGT